MMMAIWQGQRAIQGLSLIWEINALDKAKFDLGLSLVSDTHMGEFDHVYLARQIGSSDFFPLFYCPMCKKKLFY